MIIMILLSVGLVIGTTFPKFENTIADPVKNQLMDQVTAEAVTVDGIVKEYRSELDALAEDKDIIAFGIQNLATYIMDEEGVIFGHTEANKVGTAVKNSVIQDVVRRLGLGEQIQETYCMIQENSAHAKKLKTIVKKYIL